MITNTPRVTMRQIAEKFGVSHATVSLALRNHPRISIQLRKKIQDKALEMGYQPDPLLTVLAHYRHNQTNSPVQAAIAWINCWANPKDLRRLREFDFYWHGADACAKKFGYHLEEFVVDQNMSLSRLEKILITRNIKGILIPPHRDPNHGLEKFNWDHFSVVRLGRTVQQPEMHLVTSDQAANAELAFTQVMKKGYRRIGFAGRHQNTRMFTAGFMHAQLDIPEKLRLPPLIGEFSRKENAPRVHAWIKKYKPQVIVTDVPEMPTVVTDFGYRVPEDIALVGLSQLDGNISACIDQHGQEIGRVACLTLISLINDFAQGIPPIFRQILVEGSWVDGPSCPDLANGRS